MSTAELVCCRGFMHAQEALVMSCDCALVKRFGVYEGLIPWEGLRQCRSFGWWFLHGVVCCGVRFLGESLVCC